MDYPPTKRPHRRHPLNARLLEPVRKSHWPTTKVLRRRMGRTPAENAENAEVYWEGEDSHIGAVSRNCLGLLNRDISPPEKK